MNDEYLEACEAAEDRDERDALAWRDAGDAGRLFDLADAVDDSRLIAALGQA